MANLKDEMSYEMKSFSGSKMDMSSPFHDYSGSKISNMKPPSSLTPKVYGEEAFESMSTGNGSTLVYQGNFKRGEADRQSSDGTASTWSTSAKSEISTEVGLTLTTGSFGMDARKLRVSHVNGADEGLDMTTHESQCRTESSCSNFIPVIPPISLSNHSFQDNLTDVCSFKNYGGSVDRCKSKASDRSSEERLSCCSGSSLSAQIARNAIRNARSRNSVEISKAGANHNPLVTEKGDTSRQDKEISREWGHAIGTPEDGVLHPTDVCNWVPRKISSTEERLGGTTIKGLVCSGNVDIFNCTNKTEENTRSCDEHANAPTYRSAKRTIVSETGHSRNFSKMEEIGPEMVEKSNGEFYGIKSCESSKTQDRGTFIAGFDLNENINIDGVDDFIQPVAETVSSHGVIRVVAKSGIRKGSPITPLKFEGGLGWKGSAQTSAFRPAVPPTDRKTCIQNYEDSQKFKGIDLNVAFGEDSPNGLPTEQVFTSSSTLQDSRPEIGSRRTGSLSIDLNCLYDAADEFNKPSVAFESENPASVDLNLSVNTSHGGTANNVHWLLRHGHPLQGNKNSDSEKRRGQESSFNGDAYNADLAVQRFANHAPRAQQFLVAAPNSFQPLELMGRVAPFQPLLPFTSHVSPPQSYQSSSSSHFNSRDHPQSMIHYSNNTMPYARYSHEHGVFPALMNPSMVQSSIGAPHFVQVAHGHGTSNIATSIPKLDAKSEDYLSRNGTKIDEARQFLFLAKSSPTDEQIKLHREALYANSMKRKEPEGGLQYYQLGHRHAT